MWYPTVFMIGWCLAMAMPLRALCTATDLVPCYVAEHQLKRLAEWLEHVDHAQAELFQ